MAEEIRLSIGDGLYTYIRDPDGRVDVLWDGKPLIMNVARGSFIDDLVEYTIELKARVAALEGVIDKGLDAFTALAGQSNDPSVNAIQNDAISAMKTSLSALALQMPLCVVRHVKRGSIYEVIGAVEMQIAVPESGERVIREGDRITAYRDAHGKMWGRFPDEFEDGRFVGVESEEG